MSFDLHHGDCLEVLRELPENSVDSFVTDPPYGLSFMGKAWDGAVPSAEVWREALRVLKPGGHLLAFAGTRTQHRMACAIEDAGFEIRDMIAWVYGSGFPKSHNVGKALPEWDGWGTALKPALEPITVARKPLVGTVAANVTEHGTGVLNIDGCRVPSDGGKHRVNEDSQERRYTEKGSTNFAATPGPRGGGPLGRHPANMIHDGSDEVLAAFPEAKGQAGAVGPEHGARSTVNCYGDYGPRPHTPPRIETDKSAARFYYCAKASKADRDDGLDHMEERQFVQWQTGNGASGKPSSMSEGRDTRRRNQHPTVKPTDLMRYLVRLVTPPGGTVCDPFMGSGSTGRGAMLEGFNFVGIELDADYVEISRARIEAARQARADKIEEERQAAAEATRQADLFMGRAQ